MTITAKQVGELRERTGASMMECKRALEIAAGDVEAAVDHLRKTGLKTAEKKASRDTGQGRVVVSLRADARAAAIISLCCETDFAARNDEFERLGRELSALALASGAADAAALLQQRSASLGDTADGAIKALVAKTGENIRLARAARVESAQGRVGAYVHHTQKVGALAAVKDAPTGGGADEFLKKLCMHVVAAKPVPQYLRRTDVPAADIERERAVLRESDDVKKKPAEMQEKVLQGRLEKFYAERVLPEQPWILDPNLSVAKALAAALGPAATIEAFERFEIGG